MKHFNILILALLVIHISIQAQNKRKIDSLQALVVQREPEERADIYIEISKELLRFDFALCEAYLDSAVLFAGLFNDQKKNAEISIEIGAVYQGAAVDTVALAYFRQALEKNRVLNDKEGISQSLFRIGSSFFWQAMYDSAKYYLDAAEKLVEKTGDKKLLSDIIYARSDIAKKEGDMTRQIILLKKAESIKLEIEDIEGLNNLYSSKGNYFFIIGQMEEAIVNYREAKKYRLLLNQGLRAATMDNYIANCYVYLREYGKAIESYEDAIEIYTAYNYKRGIANAYNGMAIVFEGQKQYDKAKETYLARLDIFQEMNDREEIAITLNNLGILYSEIALDTMAVLFGKKIIDSIFEESTDKYLVFFSAAIDYFEHALEITSELDDKQLISKTLNNIGQNYLHSGKPDLAVDYFNRALLVSEEQHDLRELASGNLYLGEINLHRSMFDLALQYLNKCLEYAREVNYLEIQQLAYLNISKLYARLNNHRKALDFYKLHISVKDSMVNKEKRALIEEFEAQKAKEVERTGQMIENINVLWEQEKELQGSKMRIQKIIIISFSLLLVLTLVSSFYMFRAYRNKQKANKLLVEQKEEIASQRDEIETQRDEISQQKDILIHQKEQLEEQKQAMTDSINYASKIQSAIIPSDEIMRHYLPKHFVLFKPRDIVSGDFYWIGTKENKVIVAAVDCTGHGVPGAFMSVLGSSMLNEIMGRIKKVQSNEILDELRDLIIIALHQTGRMGEAKDGMDMVLCIFDFKNLKLQFSGAHNPLYLIRDSKLIEYKGDKMPIGIHTHAGKPFSKTDIPLRKGDAIYLFSDGYADQFGGPSGKKYKYSQFKNVLLEIQDNIMHDQKEILEQQLKDWMSGTVMNPVNYEQVDDILVMGIKI